MTATQMVYDIIRHSGPISRVEMHRKFHIRQATITRVTERLLDDGLIRCEGKDAAGLGRNPELLVVDGSAFRVLGLHAVRGAIRGGIVAAGGVLEHYSTCELPPVLDRRGFLDALGKFAVEMAGKAEISGVGLAMPGEVDFKDGSLRQAAMILPGLEDVPCKRHLASVLPGLPVAVDHDCHMIALAEAFWGRARSHMDVCALFIGQGIGGGFLFDGRLHRGVRNRSGEIGHIPLRHDGPPCKCGLKGCFEALASIPAIEADYGGGIGFQEVVRRAGEGEARALDSLRKAADYIGEAVAIVSDMLDIELLVVDGDIVAAKEFIEEPMLASAVSRMHSKMPEDRKPAVFSGFGEDAGVLGAAAECSQAILAGHGIEV